MERCENSEEYVELVEFVARKLGKTNRWVIRVLDREPDSLMKFYHWFEHQHDHDDTEIRRRYRDTLLSTCPIDTYPHILHNIWQDPYMPREWSAFLYTPFERMFWDCVNGKDVDLSGLDLLKASRCAIAKLTLQQRNIM